MPLPTPKRVRHSSNKIRALLYGDTGQGKTTTAGSAIHYPALASVLVLNFDRGQASLPQDDRISVIDVDLNGSYTDTLEGVVNELCKPSERRSPAYQPFQTLVIDSVSALRDQLLDEVQGNKSRTWTTWNTMHNHMVGAIDRIITANQVHLILLAGSKDVYSDGQFVGVKPEVNPSLWSKIQYRMDYILYCKFQNGRYIVRTHMRDDGVTLKIRNVEFANALAKYNDVYNREALIASGMDADKVKAAPFESVAYSMFADTTTFARFYKVYLTTVDKDK